MKFLVVAFALAAAVHADVSHLIKSGKGPDAEAVVVRSDTDVRPDGYQFSFETSNGISGQESGQVKNVGREDEALEVQGLSQFTSSDGVPVQLTYIANENGFQPQGEHLPTVPPTQAIPDYILRAIKYIEDHPPKPETPSKRF